MDPCLTDHSLLAALHTQERSQVEVNEARAIIVSLAAHKAFEPFSRGQMDHWRCRASLAGLAGALQVTNLDARPEHRPGPAARCLGHEREV